MVMFFESKQSVLFNEQATHTHTKMKQNMMGFLKIYIFFCDVKKGDMPVLKSLADLDLLKS